MSTDTFFVNIFNHLAPPERDPEAEVAAHFEVAAFSVAAALTGALITALVVARAGVLEADTALLWLAFMMGMGATHIGLSLRFQRIAPERRRWRFWAAASTAITFAESLGWGLAPLALPRLDSPKALLLVMLTTIGVSAGSVIGYGRYLPTRIIAFLTPPIPFLLYSFMAEDPVVHGAFFLLVLYMSALGHLGLAADRGFQREVSMRKRNEALAQELAYEKQIAERATLAKSTFLAAASHDLRQPIHALGLYLGALRSSALSQDAASLVDKMNASLVSMDRLFSSILDISRLDAGVVETHRETFDLDAFLQGLVRDFEEEAHQKGLRFAFEPTNARIDSDRVLLERILRNIVSNAIFYTRLGGVRIRGRRRGRKLALQVWDSGCGIGKHHLSSIFDEYFQIANPERDREKGLGLGLAIVRRLSALIGANVTVQSREGRGSFFAVHLSLAAPGVSCELPEPNDTIAPDDKGLIVVVDDEGPILDAMREVLRRWGYSVLTAETGAQALSPVECFSQPPRLLICDFRLREHETGAAVARAFREHFGNQLLQSHHRGHCAKPSCPSSMSGCLLLHKPLPYGKLRAAITNLIRRTDSAMIE